MPQLLSAPNGYANGSANPASWPGYISNGEYSNGGLSHVTGTTSTDNHNSKSLNETINTGRSGNIYKDSGGFYSNVQTKTSTVFKSKHFIGHLNGNSISSGSSISTSTKSTWMRDVIGFHCECSAAPTGSGSEADGCGRVDNMRVCGVYADSSNKVRILEMTAGGVKLGSHVYDTNPSTSWQKFSYKLDSTDAKKVIDGAWMFYGWLIRFEHKKTCGGGQKQKNCTGRIRYMRPIVSTSSSTSTSWSVSQLIMHYDTPLSNAKSTTGGRYLQAL